MHFKKESGALTINEQLVFIQSDKPITTSRLIAKTFEKRHDNVLRDIETLACSDGFRLLNFEESTYKNEQNKIQREYLITKDGFAMLAFGYTGEKAMQFKEKYIERFNVMEGALQQKQIANHTHANETRQVQAKINKCFCINEPDGFTWYAASQLRRLSGKSTTGGYRRKVDQIGKDKVKQLLYRGQLCWFIREDAVADILGVRQNHLTAVAMVNLLSQPKLTQMQFPFNKEGGANA